VNVITVDQLDATLFDVGDPALELFRPRALPLGITRFFFVEAVVQLIGELLSFLRGEAEQLAAKLCADRHCWKFTGLRGVEQQASAATGATQIIRDLPEIGPSRALPQSKNVTTVAEPQRD
jgi:hypothetical protein